MASWNQRPQGVGPTEGNISFRGGLSPSFQTGNATSDAVQQAIAAIAQILRQRQQDKIANQLLAVDNAPKAVAVDGTQPGSGTPDTALTQAMVQRNLGQGLPAQDSGRVPDRGGVEGLQWADLIHKRDQERMKEQWALEDRPLDVQLKQAQIVEKLRPPIIHRDPNDLTPDFKYKMEHPDQFPEPVKYDPVAMSDYTAQRTAYESERNSLDKAMRKYGFTPEEFAKVDTNVRGGVSTDEKGGHHQLGGVTFKSAIDFGDEATNSFGQKIKPGSALTEQDAANLANSAKSPNAIVAEGTVGGKKFKIPYNEYYDLLNRARNIPTKPTAPAPIRGGPSASPNSGIVQVKTVEEARALPPGTQFQTPYGRIKIR